MAVGVCGLALAAADGAQPLSLLLLSGSDTTGSHAVAALPTASVPVAAALFRICASFGAETADAAVSSGADVSSVMMQLLLRS